MLRQPQSLTNRENCHLTRHQLSLCVSLIENGVNPEALAVCFMTWLLDNITNNVGGVQNVIKDIQTQYPAPPLAVDD